MNGLEERFVEKTYYNVRDGRVKTSFLITLMEKYLRRTLSADQKEQVYNYAERIRNGEMSFEEYWELYQAQRAKIRVI